MTQLTFFDSPAFTAGAPIVAPARRRAAEVDPPTETAGIGPGDGRSASPAPRLLRLAEQIGSARGQSRRWRSRQVVPIGVLAQAVLRRHDLLAAARG